MFDVLIIGAGVVGSSIARELSRYQLKTAVLERREDIAMGTTKANSGIVHAGFDAKPGTMKAKMNILGNPMYDKLSKELDFPFKKVGSLVLCFSEEDRPTLEDLLQKGINNNVPGVRIVEKAELKELEPNISDGAVAALFAPTGGITGPYELNMALAENANKNGVEFFMNQNVTSIEQKKDKTFLVKTPTDTFETKILVNAAGVYADFIHNMLSKEKLSIIPRAGQYVLFDRTVGDTVNHTIFQLPTKMGKGVLVTPTVDGNLLIGPTATDIDDKEDLATTQESFDTIVSRAKFSIEKLPMSQVITAFTGLRAHSTDDDFIIQHVPDVENMIDVAGIESPGLTAAPAIGVYVKELIGEITELKANPNFDPIRKGITHFRLQDIEGQKELIKKNHAYGKIVCRCEMVPEAEIVEAINRPLGAKDLDGVKRRTRAGMGRCQGGFCSPIVVDILARELNLSPLEITKFGGESNVLIGENKKLGGKN